MRTLGWLMLALLTTAGWANAALKTPDNAPIEITSTGETHYENGVATARDNVAIHVADADIYADYARYDTSTHEVLAEGHVRIYRALNIYLTDRAVYNVETKQISATNARTESLPYFISGASVSEISDNGYRIENGSFTTDDSSSPDFHLRARTIRVYEKDRVVFQNVTLYVGKVPIFWWPYLYQSLNDAFSFTVSPAFLSSWGPSLLTQVTFPITEKIKGRVRLDYRTARCRARFRSGHGLRKRRQQHGQAQNLLSSGPKSAVEPHVVAARGSSDWKIPRHSGGSHGVYPRYLRYC